MNLLVKAFAFCVITFLIVFLITLFFFVMIYGLLLVVTISAVPVFAIVICIYWLVKLKRGSV